MFVSCSKSGGSFFPLTVVNVLSLQAIEKSTEDSDLPAVTQ